MHHGSSERWAELAQRIRARDAAAEDELARLFYPHLLAMAASRLSDRETAREIAQEALLAVVSALRQGRLREPEKLPAFVVGTGRNLINSFARKRARRPQTVNLGFDEASVPDPEPDEGGTSLEREERMDVVLRALEELKEIDRKILFLILSEGLKPEEIARETGLKPEIVRLRKCRALKRLRREFKRMKQKGRLGH
jgi:RNA polymerase sigma factor (sigma-70 family)